MKYIISTILFIVSSVGFAQSVDSTAFKFRTIRVGVDTYGVIRDLVKPFRSGLEVSGDLDFKKYIFSLDLGTFSYNRDSLPKYKYTNSGSYFRVGTDINLIHRDADQSIVSFGLRYGRARFKDHLTYEYTDAVLGTYSNQVKDNNNGSAGWFEVNMGMKIKILKRFWMGYRTSYKFGLRTRFQEFEPFQIPGFGPAETVTESDTYWGFNYYLMIGI